MYSLLVSGPLIVEEKPPRIRGDVQKALKNITSPAVRSTPPAYKDYLIVDAYVRSLSHLDIVKRETNGKYGTIHDVHTLAYNFAIAKYDREYTLRFRDVIYYGTTPTVVVDPLFLEDYRKAIRGPWLARWKWFSQFEYYPHGLIRYADISSHPMRLNKRLYWKWFEIVNSLLVDGERNKMFSYRKYEDDYVFSDEYKIGRMLNKLKQQCDTFVWTYPFVRSYIADKHAYIMTEKIPHTDTLDTLKASKYEMHLIMKRIIHALTLANQAFGFHHNDLHANNILIKETPNTKFTIDGITYISNYTPYIIDFGKATVFQEKSIEQDLDRLLSSNDSLHEFLQEPNELFTPMKRSKMQYSPPSLRSVVNGYHFVSAGEYMVGVQGPENYRLSTPLETVKVATEEEFRMAIAQQEQDGIEFEGKIAIRKKFLEETYTTIVLPPMFEKDPIAIALYFTYLRTAPEKKTEETEFFIEMQTLYSLQMLNRPLPPLNAKQEVILRRIAKHVRVKEPKERKVPDFLLVNANVYHTKYFYPSIRQKTILDQLVKGTLDVSKAYSLFWKHTN